jgi:hypothetical protein
MYVHTKRQYVYVVHRGSRPCFVRVLHIRPAEWSLQFSIFVFCFLKMSLQNCEKDCWLRQVCLSICLSDCPSVRSSLCMSSWNNSTVTGRIVIKSDTENFSKICRENKIFTKSDKNNQYFTWNPIIRIHLLLHLTHFLLEWEIFRTEVLEKIEKHFVFNILLPKTVPFTKQGNVCVVSFHAYISCIFLSTLS